MTYRIILSFIICLISPLSLAQEYLIKANGDSLPGKISIVTNTLGQEYVRIKTGKDKQMIDILHIRKIVTKKGELIEPLLIGEKYYFGKRIKAGYLNYYRYTPEGSTEKFIKDVLYKLDGSYIEPAGIIGFRGQVANFLLDCPTVSQAVKGKEYTRKDLDKIVKDYNLCIENRPIAYEQENRKGPEKHGITGKIEKKENKVADFQTLLRYSDKIANKEDVTEMFNDLVRKMNAGEEIPQYLTRSLKDAVKLDPMLSSLLEDILNKK